MNLVKLYWTFKLNNHRYKISQLSLNWKPKRNLSDSLIYQNSFNIASITNTRVSQWFKIALYTLKLWFTLFPYLNSKLLWGLFIQHLLIFEVEAQDLRHAFLGVIFIKLSNGFSKSFLESSWQESSSLNPSDKVVFFPGSSLLPDFCRPNSSKPHRLLHYSPYGSLNSLPSSHSSCVQNISHIFTCPCHNTLKLCKLHLDNDFSYAYVLYINVSLILSLIMYTLVA